MGHAPLLQILMHDRICIVVEICLNDLVVDFIVELADYNA
jgi:hypothetical protein